MKLPAFIRKLGNVKPVAEPAITTITEAISHINANGGEVRPDAPHDGIGAHNILFRGWSHGGVTDEGLISIADEDARAVAKKRVPKPRARKVEA